MRMGLGVSMVLTLGGMLCCPTPSSQALGCHKCHGYRYSYSASGPATVHSVSPGFATHSVSFGAVPVFANHSLGVTNQASSFGLVPMTTSNAAAAYGLVPL